MNSTPSPLLSVAAVASGAAGLIHAAAAGSHAELATLPQLFAVAAVAQVGWAVLMVQRRPSWLVAAGMGIQVMAIITLVASRTVGISFVDALDDGSGLGSIGLQDGVVLGLEVLALTAAALHVSAGASLRLPALAVPAVVAASVFAAVPAMAQPHDHGSDLHDEVAVAAEDGHDHDGGADDATDGDDVAADPAAPDDHDDGDHGDDGVVVASDDAPTDAELGYPASFVSWLDTASTPAQRDAAEQLILDTAEAMTAFPDEASLQAAGFVSIGDGATGWEHYVNVQRILDPRVLDPADIESVVLKVNPDGTKQVASAMYLLPFGMTMTDAPDIAGDLTEWHDHQNLCWDGIRVVGTTDATGSCPRGEFRPTQPMIHVWMIPHECGPFAGIDGSHGAGCAHGH